MGEGPKLSMDYEIADDKSRAFIEISPEGRHVFWVDAKSCEALLALLRIIRGTLLPEVPKELAEGPPETVKIIRQGPHWHVSVDLFGGGVVYAARDPEQGWLHFLLDPNTARTLGRSLIEHADQVPAVGRA